MQDQDGIIFGAEAQKYWDEGIPAIPLHHWTKVDKDGRKMGKAPLEAKWSQYAKEFPSLEKQQYWLGAYPSNNIGVPMGPLSNIQILDIDTNDPLLIEAIMSVVPTSPWVRVGQKGKALAYRYNDKIRNFAINAKPLVEGGEPPHIMDFISTGRQLVMPPSMHPDIRKPYQANCNLYDVHKNLPVLPDDLEDRIRAKLLTLIELQGSSQKEKFALNKKISFGARDVSMTKLAGGVVYDIFKGTVTVLDGFNYMMTMVTSTMEQVEGDEVDYNKGISKIVEFLIRDVHKGKVLPMGWDDGLSDEEKKEYGLNFTEDQQAWTFDQIMEFLKLAYEDKASTQAARTAATETMLKKITVSPNIGRLDRERVLNFMSKSSGDKLSAGKYGARLKEMEQGEIAGANHTEVAEEALREFSVKETTLHAHKGDFMGWNGSHWEEVKEDPTIWAFIAKYYGHMDAARKRQDHKGIAGVMKSICPQGIVKTETRGVNFANGFLTRDLVLVPHNPDYGMVYTLPFSYDVKLGDPAHCPKFMGLLNKCWGDDEDRVEKIQALREAMAATIFGAGTSLQKAVLLHGAKYSGKSQILEIMMALVPEEATATMPPKLWNVPHALVTLKDKILNVCGEFPDSSMIPGEEFKLMVCGEPMADRALYHGHETLRFIATHWFAANSLPRSKDTKGGFDRRWLILHFSKVTPPKDRILDYGKLIAAEEREAICAWAVQIFPDLMKHADYTYPKSHFKHFTDMSMGNSSTRQFCEEKVVVEEGSTIAAEALLTSYYGYNIRQGLPHGVAMPRFIEEVLQIFEENHQEGKPKVSLERVQSGETTKRLFKNIRVAQ